jgi:hypothetical protein
MVECARVKGGIEMSDTNGLAPRLFIWEDEYRTIVSIALDGSVDSARRFVIDKKAEDLGPEYVAELIQREPQMIEPNEGAVFEFARVDQAGPA